MRSVKAVLFDYGLVLSGPPDPTAWESMKRVFGAEEADFHAAYWHYRHDYDRGTLSGEAYWRAIANDLRQNVSAQQLATLFAEDTALWTQPNAPMIEWAGRLQRAGIMTGILSNIGDAMEDGILRQLDWLSGFTHHTFSHRLRLAKPEPAIYQHASQGLGIAPEDILFIDDREENIVGALEAGMQAVRYIDHAQFTAELRDRGMGSLLEV